MSWSLIVRELGQVPAIENCLHPVKLFLSDQRFMEAFYGLHCRITGKCYPSGVRWIPEDRREFGKRSREVLTNCSRSSSELEEQKKLKSNLVILKVKGDVSQDEFEEANAAFTTKIYDV